MSLLLLEKIKTAVTNLLKKGGAEILADVKKAEATVEEKADSFISEIESIASPAVMGAAKTFRDTVSKLHSDELKIASAKSVIESTLENTLPVLELEGKAELLKWVNDGKALLLSAEKAV